MRGLVDALYVLLEHVELDIDVLCKLYTACEEVVLDPDKLIDWILETSEPTTVIAFHEYTHRKRSNTAVQRLLRADFFLNALEFLDDKCDQEVFTKVLSYPYDERILCEADYSRMVKGLLAMKILGYKREIHLFEAVLGRVTNQEMNQEIFCEMVEEHPHSAAKPEIYQRLLYSAPGLDFKHLVAMEAKTKGIQLKVTEVFRGGNISNWKQALGLLFDLGAKPSEAFQLTLDAIDLGFVEYCLQPLLEKAVKAKAVVDPTSKVIYLGDKFKNNKFANVLGVLANGMQKRLILLNDRELADAWGNKTK